jgi:YggT family protein
MVSFRFFAIIAQIVHIALTLYIYVIIARAVISWIRVNPYNSIVQLIFKITEPPLEFLRRFVPIFGGLDLSPVILIFIVMIVDRILSNLLLKIAFVNF